MSVESNFRRAASDYRRAQERLDIARVALHTTMKAARDAGMTYDAMAQEMGVTRQRVMTILRG